MKKTKTNTTHKDNNTKNTINWTEYTESLVKRGSFMVWIEEALLNGGINSNSTSPNILRSSLGGRPKLYSDALILLALTFKEIYHLRLRQTEGFMTDMFKLLGICLLAPDYTTLSRRAKNLNVPLTAARVKRNESLIVLIDSTGIKVMGEGEWKIRMHGKTKMKLYRKVHIALDYDSQDVIGLSVSDASAQDADVVPTLVDQINSQKLRAKEMIADGAYDRQKTYRLAQSNNMRLTTPPEPRARIRQDDPIWRCRNTYVADIKKYGKEKWKEQVDYHRRSLVETVMYRLKTAFTDEMKARTDASQLTTMRIRAKILNRFNDMSRPSLLGQALVTKDP